MLSLFLLSFQTKLSAQDDHKAMMAQLKMTSIRPGRNGMDPKHPNFANYDESKANPFPVLPDPLTFKDGKKVTTPKMWTTKRRAEIVEDFDREIYGRVPAKTPKVTWEVVSSTPGKNGEFEIITKKLLGHVDNSAHPSVTVNIQFSLSIPASAKGTVRS